MPTPKSRAFAGGEVVLSAHGLTKRFRARLAVDDVSFEVRAGQTIGIVGESGSGKTTVASMLLAMQTPDAGSVTLDGSPWSDLRERERRPLRGRLQLVDQNPFGAFDPRWSVERIIREAVALTEVPTRARVLELLAQVGLGESHASRRPKHLSGGQRQRVAIARALARRPAILVCDEPVSALDLRVQASVLALLEGLQRDLGLAMVFISHDLGVIAQVSDEILVMRDGAIVERGATVDVLERPQHPFTRELVAARPLA